MLIKTKVLGKANRERGDQQRVDHQANSKLVQHHRGEICSFEGFNYKDGGLNEIQCI
jgi:hypothetical protein